jgi:hypothetical protein
MDKTDYSADCDVEGWVDADRLINNVIKIKNRYQSLNLTLVNIRQTASEDRLPPNNYYNSEFVDFEGFSIFFPL